MWAYIPAVTIAFKFIEGKLNLTREIYLITWGVISSGGDIHIGRIYWQVRFLREEIAVVCHVLIGRSESNKYNQFQVILFQRHINNFTGLHFHIYEKNYQVINCLISRVIDC